MLMKKRLNLLTLTLKLRKVIQLSLLMESSASKSFKQLLFGWKLKGEHIMVLPQTNFTTPPLQILHAKFDRHHRGRITKHT